MSLLLVQYQVGVSFDITGDSSRENFTNHWLLTDNEYDATSWIQAREDEVDQMNSKLRQLPTSRVQYGFHKIYSFDEISALTLNNLKDIPLGILSKLLLKLAV